MLPTPRRVLVVEDDRHIRELVCLHLGLEGYDCLQAENGKDALAVAQDRPLDLVVLDVMLPGIDGLAVCRWIRTQSDTPVILLTARGEETDRIVGLELGADDYVVKPFSPRELAVRARNLLKRTGSTPSRDRRGDA
jgi:DNA-binding response OmpR family regulator